MSSNRAISIAELARLAVLHQRQMLSLWRLTLNQATMRAPPRVLQVSQISDSLFRVLSRVARLRLVLPRAVIQVANLQTDRSLFLLSSSLLWFFFLGFSRSIVFKARSRKPGIAISSRSQHATVLRLTSSLSASRCCVSPSACLRSRSLAPFMVRHSSIPLTRCV